MTVFTPPGTIDPTGAADVTVAMQAWLTGTVTSGTVGTRNTVLFPGSARYRIEGTLYLGSASNPTVTPKHDLNVDMNGAEFFCTVPNPFGCECISNSVAIGSNNWLRYDGHGLDGTKAVKINGVVHTTGITNGGTYWPIVIDANHFRLSLTQGGSVITLGNTGSAYDTFQILNAPFPAFSHAFLFNSTNAGNDNFTRGTFWAAGCVNIRFMDSAGACHITGAQTNGVMGTYDARYEGQAGIRVTGGTNIEIDHIFTRGTLGDGFQNLGGPSFLNIHDCTVTGPGRHGMSVGNNGATDVTIKNNSIIGAPRHSVDLEDDINPATRAIRRIAVSGNYCRIGNNPGPNNLNLWFAMGGESSDMGDIVIGGLLGHPEDGNLIVGGVMTDDVRNAFTHLASTRRGPYTVGYNVGGGQITIHTTAGSATATFSGLTNNTRFTNKQILQFQAISATGLPKPCEINDMPTPTTITLSAAATATGTVLATFGSPFGDSPPAGALDFLHIDGAHCFFNTIIIAPNDGAIGTAGSMYEDCTNIDDHDNIVIGGPVKTIVSTIPVVNGSATLVGGGLLRASGVNVPPITGSAKLTGGGLLKLTGTNVPPITGSAVLAGGGLMTLLGASVPDVLGSASLDGGGLLHLIGAPVPDVVGSAALIGGGLMQITGSDPVTFAAATLVGGGVMTVTGENVPDILGAATLIGGGIMSMSGVSQPDTVASAALVGGGLLAMTGAPVPETFGSMILDGGGLLEAVGVSVPAIIGSAALVGGGLLQIILSSPPRHGLDIDAPIDLDAAVDIDGLVAPRKPILVDSVASIAPSVNNVVILSSINRVLVDSEI